MKIDPETKKQIQEIVKDTYTQKGGTSGSFATPRHYHNGSDSPQIKSADLLPYPINPQVNDFDQTFSGTQFFFDESNLVDPIGATTFYYWGQKVFLGNNGYFDGTVITPTNSYTIINLADFYLDASQSISQAINAFATNTIVFDSMSFQRPTGAYDDFVNPVTGEFRTVNNPRGNNQIYGAFSDPIWYQITASVGVVPRAAVAGETADINIEVDGTIIHFNTFYFVGATDPIILTISAMLTIPITNNIRISVTNNSANPIDTTGNSLVTYFKLKQLK